MPISKDKKESVLAELRAELERAEGALFTDFRGVDVAGMTALRALLRAEGVRYYVAKRTLAELALAEEPAETVELLLAGATGIAFVAEEPVRVAKILVDFQKEYETFTIKGGLWGGEFLAASQVGQLARTPPREVLWAKLLGAMNAPVGSFAAVLAGVVRRAVATLQAIADQKGTETENAGN
ncbi:MAG: 50S ribosomal protein L10 [Candidatus Coatesbacteria bacterium]|nr:MAG: 50S ribosomal protein L10 [Candidatus Coatesbacteria bacterium]